MHPAKQRDYRIGMAGFEWDAGAGHHARLVTVIADPGMGRDRALEAVRAVGARVADTLAWRDLAGAEDLPVWPGAAIADTEEADDALLATVLPRLDASALASLARVVVVLAPAQIDLVAAALFGGHVQLLCGPGPTDRITALTLATAGTGAALADPAREADAERLRRLGDELARIAQALDQMARGGGGEVSDRTPAYGAEPAEATPGDVTPAEVRGAIRSRRLRDAEFGAGWFEDPAWDMLLDLFAAELEAGRVSVSSLCIAAAVAPTTALRWMARMTDAGLLRRMPDPADRRRAFVTLSDTASAAMHRYCENARRAGLGIA